jgi:hypothetical protein
MIQWQLDTYKFSQAVRVWRAVRLNRYDVARKFQAKTKGYRGCTKCESIHGSSESSGCTAGWPISSSVSQLAVRTLRSRSNDGLLGLYKCLGAIAGPFLLSSSDKMAPAQTLPDVRAPSTPVLKQGVQEDYEGNYRFAPIEEAQVARAMIKRLASIWLVSPHWTLTARGKKSGTTTPCMNVSSRTLSSSVLVALACLAPITSQRLVQT